jgi:invasion protein IalB
MKQILIAALLTGSASLAHAQIAPAANGPSVPNSQSRVNFVSAVQPGDKVAPGDLVRTIRPFNHWSLICDQLLGRKRVCQLQTSARTDQGGTVTWDIAPVKATGPKGEAIERPMSLLRLPRDAQPEGGVSIGVEGLERATRIDGCDAAGCASGSLFEGKLVELVAGTSTVTVSFDRGGKRERAIIAMAGFKEAVEAIGTKDAGAPVVVMPREPGTATAQPVTAKADKIRPAKAITSKP